MAKHLKPTGFWSYASSDEAALGGRLSQLRLLLTQHLQANIGRTPQVQIFQDKAAIGPGHNWQAEIRKALGAASFMIPVITPAFLQSPMCCDEVRMFRQRETALGRDDLIFPLHYIDVDDVDPSRKDEVHDPDVLALLRQRQWIDFRSLRLRDPASEPVLATLDMIAVAIRGRLRTHSSTNADAPPSLPSQSAGTQFMLDERGVIRFAPPEALDVEGNNLAALRSLHPRLQQLAAALAATFGRTNAHEPLTNCLQAYRNLIDQPLQDIDFHLLCAEGVVLENTQVADAADKEEPELDPAAASTLASLLQVHAMFVTATSAGSVLLAKAAAWRRRPEQEQDFRAAATSFTEALQDKPDVIGAAEAATLQDTAREIGEGPHPDRASAVATGMLRNVAIVMTAGATVASLPVAAAAEFGTAGMIAGGLFALLGSEALIRSRPFGSVAYAITSRLNNLSESELREALAAIAENFRTQLQFVHDAEQALRRLAGDRQTFGWLHRSLNWIRQPVPGGQGSPLPIPPYPLPPASAGRTAFPVPQLVTIPAGNFIMGIPEEESRREKTDDDDARPLHTVTLARPFRLGKYPVTRGEYAAFVDATRYDGDNGRWRDPGFEQTERHPVVNVSADDAESYVAWLKQMAGPGWRLPSEAEWEYAARAGNGAARFWGNSFRQEDRYVHIASGQHSGTAEVGTKLANNFDLHDMLGNVWEWVADPWHDDYTEAPQDGSVWAAGGNDALRVLRGGSWIGDPRDVRVGYRIHVGRDYRSGNVGFRVARTTF